MTGRGGVRRAYTEGKSRNHKAGVFRLRSKQRQHCRIIIFNLHSVDLVEYGSIRFTIISIRKIHRNLKVRCALYGVCNAQSVHSGVLDAVCGNVLMCCVYLSKFMVRTWRGVAVQVFLIPHRAQCTHDWHMIGWPVKMHLLWLLSAWIRVSTHDSRQKAYLNFTQKFFRLHVFTKWKFTAEYCTSDWPWWWTNWHVIELYAKTPWLANRFSALSGFDYGRTKPRNI